VGIRSIIAKDKQYVYVEALEDTVYDFHRIRAGNNHGTTSENKKNDFWIVYSEYETWKNGHLK